MFMHVGVRLDKLSGLLPERVYAESTSEPRYGVSELSGGRNAGENDTWDH